MRHHENPEWENGLANVYNNLAAMLKNRDELAEAGRLYERAIETRDLLISRAAGEEEKKKSEN